MWKWAFSLNTKKLIIFNPKIKIRWARNLTDYLFHPNDDNFVHCPSQCRTPTGRVPCISYTRSPLVFCADSLLLLRSVLFPCNDYNWHKKYTNSPVLYLFENKTRRLHAITRAFTCKLNSSLLSRGLKGHSPPQGHTRYRMQSIFNDHKLN
jgi:hypothetical protein